MALNHDQFSKFSIITFMIPHTKQKKCVKITLNDKCMFLNFRFEREVIWKGLYFLPDTYVRVYSVLQCC